MVDRLLDQGRSSEIALDDFVKPRLLGTGQSQRYVGASNCRGGIAERGREPPWSRSSRVLRQCPPRGCLDAQPLLADYARALPREFAAVLGCHFGSQVSNEGCIGRVAILVEGMEVPTRSP